MTEHDFNNKSHLFLKTYKQIISLSLFRSGPPSCLCSEVAACENTGDNEVDVLPNIFQVRQKYRSKNYSVFENIFRRRHARNFVPATLSVITTLGIVSQLKPPAPVKVTPITRSIYAVLHSHWSRANNLWL